MFSGSRVRNNWGSQFGEWVELAKSFMELGQNITLSCQGLKEIEEEDGSRVGPIMQNVFHKKKKSFVLFGPRLNVTLRHLTNICAVNVLAKKKCWQMTDLLKHKI